MEKVNLGVKSESTVIDWLADDIVLIADNIELAHKQITELQRQAAKAGLWISFEKTQCLTSIKNTPQYLKINTNTIAKTCIEYLGEWITQNNSEKIALENRLHKIKSSYNITKNLYPG